MTGSPPPQISPLTRIWRDIVAAGWREPLLRGGAHILILIMLAAGIWVGRLPIVGLGPLNAAEQLDSGGQSFVIDTTETPVSAGIVVTVPATPQFGSVVDDETALDRQVNPQTLFPERSRDIVETIVVQPGDTLTGIAARFNVDVSTVLWANAAALGDDVHALRAGQTLRIPPVDGVLHTITTGDTLESVAKMYGVTPQIIVDYRENGLADSNAPLGPGRELVIPGGRRALTLWLIPSLPRGQQADADSSFGQCAGGYTGAVGTGTFVWPAASQTLDGYAFSAVHLGIDVRAAEGDAVFASDSGIVMYAGPNEQGYGNLVVLDHGNGFESAYAQLSEIAVACGQSVLQGSAIGAAGNSGSSERPLLHFEIRQQGQSVDPRPLLP